MSNFKIHYKTNGPNLGYKFIKSICTQMNACLFVCLSVLHAFLYRFMRFSGSFRKRQGVELWTEQNLGHDCVWNWEWDWTSYSLVSALMFSTGIGTGNMDATGTGTETKVWTGNVIEIRTGTETALGTGTGTGFGTWKGLGLELSPGRQKKEH